MTYAEANEKLGSRPSLKIGNNTYLLRYPLGDGRSEASDSGQGVVRSISVRLHTTDVLDFRPDGSIVLNSGGFKTATTKARMNEWLPSQWGIQQKRGIWTLELRETEKNEELPDCEVCGAYHRAGYTGDCRDDSQRFNKPYLDPQGVATESYWRDTKHEVYGFRDGMVILADGTVEGAGKGDKGEMLLRQRVVKYAAAFVEALKAGKVPKPSNGDCWPCMFRVEEKPTPGSTQFADLKADGTTTKSGTMKPGVAGKTWGEVQGDGDHIRAHLTDKYYVPSLVFRAVEIHGSQAARGWVAACVGYEEAAGWKRSGGFLEGQVRTSLKRYCYRQLGLAA